MISTTIIVISLLFFNWRMALAAIWVMPIAFVIVLTSRKALKDTQKKTMEYKLACQDGIQEGLETLRDLRSNNMTETYRKGLNEKIKNVEKNAIVLEFKNAAFVCSAQMILKLGIGTVALVGSMLLIRGELSVLTFFLFLLVVTRMYEPLQIALQNLSAIISLDTTCERMDEILSHEEQTGKEELSNNGYDIIFDHVVFSYENGKQILSDVNFTAKQGEVTALIGPSGGGKTTVTRLAARFWDCSKGKITVGGMNVSEIEPERLLSLYSIVRSFLKDAPIILMDEATASLDVDNESVIQESISKLIQNKTVLIIAHRMRTVDGVDKIVVLKDGVVAETGTPEKLKEQNGIYKHMVDVQLETEQWKYR